MHTHTELQNLLEKKLVQLNTLRPLSKTASQKLRERFEIEMTYNSNAIEGNSLTLKETYWVIQQGITVRGKPLKDHLEAKNHKEALDYLYELVDQKNRFTFSERLIKEVHALIVKESHRDIAGKYRARDVFIMGSDHIPPASTLVGEEMSKLVSWVRRSEEKMNVVEFATLFHHKFVHIHPFEDGNGRTGRLLMNIFLMRYGFPLVIIQKNDRKKYYRVLSEADAGKYEGLLRFIAQAVLRSLNIYLDGLQQTKKKEDWLLLSQVAKKSRYSKEYLGKLAKEGKIDAHKERRNWLTTLAAVKEYEKKHRQ